MYDFGVLHALLLNFFSHMLVLEELIINQGSDFIVFHGLQYRSRDFITLLPHSRYVVQVILHAVGQFILTLDKSLKV